jgi:hypothetical protein
LDFGLDKRLLAEVGNREQGTGNRNISYLAINETVVYR